MKRSRLFWSFAVCAVVLLGGAAWLSAHRLPPHDPSEGTRQQSSSAEFGFPRPRPGAREASSEAARSSDPRAVAAGDQDAPSAVPAGTEAPRPNGAPATADAPKPTGAQALEADDVDAPPRRVRAKDAPRVNPVSGELMWSARDVTPDGGRPDAPLCGGKVCSAGQFCCGPPECGRCAYPMAGPRCPSVCPGQKSN